MKARITNTVVLRTEKTQVIEEPALREKMWAIYLDSFASSRKSCAQDQVCYDKENFLKALTDRDYWKFLVFAAETDEIVAFSLVTNNLEKAHIAYISPEYLCHQFPYYARRGRVYYVTALAVLPESQKSVKTFAAIIDSIQTFIWENQAVVAYDFSENKNQLLAKAIAEVGRRHGRPVATLELDRQRYVAQHFEAQGPPF